MHDRERYDRNRDQKLAYNAEYQKNHKEQLNATKKRWAKNNPEKRKAQVAVSNAIRDGRLIKGQCENAHIGGCNGRIEAHHDDYSRPLVVRWLCASHHAMLRHKMREVYTIDVPNPSSSPPASPVSL
jgi:hypothetical protein